MVENVIWFSLLLRNEEKKMQMNEEQDYMNVFSDLSELKEKLNETLTLVFFK